MWLYCEAYKPFKYSKQGLILLINKNRHKAVYKAFRGKTKNKRERVNSLLGYLIFAVSIMINTGANNNKSNVCIILKSPRCQILMFYQ